MAVDFPVSPFVTYSDRALEQLKSQIDSLLSPAIFDTPAMRALARGDHFVVDSDEIKGGEAQQEEIWSDIYG